MTTALILSGEGRYSDPWHPFAETSECLAGIIADAGVEVLTAVDVDDAMTRLGGIDLLVVNAGDPSRNPLPAPDLRESLAGFDAALARGISVLGVHTAASSLGDYPVWEDVLGGRWLPNVSMHPPIGVAHIRVYSDSHPIVAGLTDFETVDERYSHLRIAPEVRALAAHDLEGEHLGGDEHPDEQPILWARQHGASRVVYSALGHNARAYDSPELRMLVRRSVDWLLG